MKSLVDQDKARSAVRDLISWIGDDPNRTELAGTPARVAFFFKDFFSGYREDPLEILAPLPEKNNTGKQMIMLANIDFSSYCEHHIAPMLGKVHVAYIPDEKLVGLSKITKCVKAVSARLQLQERICHDIARYMDEALNPKGVTVMVCAIHYCMVASRENRINCPKTKTVISTRRGAFAEDDSLYNQFLAQLNSIS